MVDLQANVRVLEGRELQESLNRALECSRQRKIFEVNLYGHLVDAKLLDQLVVELCVGIALNCYIRAGDRLTVYYKFSQIEVYHEHCCLKL